MTLSIALLVLFLGIAVLVLCAWIFQDLALIRHLRRECARAHERAEQAVECLHAVSDSALRGHPMVQWRHPAPQPASDLWYWRARFDGTEYLFTEEAVRTARQRADHLLPPAGK